MTKSPRNSSRALPDPKAKPRAKMVKGVVDSVNHLESGGVNQGEGGENSETVVAETGAVPTFSESREKGGGSAQEPASVPEVQPEGPLTDGLVAQGTPFPDRARARRITRAGWMDLTEADGDMGSGFYRFAAADIDGLPQRSVMAQSIECFGKDLGAAQFFLTCLIAKARKVALASQPLLSTRPVAFRPTRLCKRARQARGEA